jgi:pyruvate-formate lyase
MNMKLLPDLSLDAMLAGSPFGPRFAAPLALERHLTGIHRAHAGAHPADRELAFLRVQTPAILQPIGDGDLLAGRVFYPLVSFGPEPGGLGYACREDLVRVLLQRRPMPESEVAEVEAMLAYWRTWSTKARTRAVLPPHVAAALPSDDWMGEPGVGFPLYRIAGTVLDYPKLLRLGLPGLRAEVAARAQALGAADENGARFLRALAGALDLLADSLRAYAAQARALAADCGEAARVAELQRIGGACEALSLRAPATLFEACQLAWLYALHSGTWNYGRMDVWLGGFLAADLAAGRTTEDEALRLLCSLWRLIKAYDNQYNNRVFIGGMGRGTPEHVAAADRFALLAIEATRRVRLNQPQLSLRFHRGQNPALMDLALTAIGEGCTLPMLYNDDVNVPAIARSMGVPLGEAEQYFPFGCGEYSIAVRAVATPNGVVNLPKALELALRNGYDPIARAFTGLPTGDPAKFAGFEDVWRAYTAQLEHVVAPLADLQRIEFDVTGREAAMLFISALTDDCLERNRPLLSGGVRYLSATLETYGNTNAADSLTAIDRLVYRERRFTLPQIVAACDADFAGPEHEAVRRAMLAVPKYGNDDEEADAMARRVHEHVCRCASGQAARVGLHSHLVVIINNWANVVLGSHTGATPDGRRSRDAFANANNPAAGADRKGATAFLRSLVKLDPALHAGAVQNMKFSRELFTKQRAKLEALLAGYWAAGGAQAMITVVSPADLEAAMAEPEKWGHLMVRVGGFSARFIDLPRGAQEEVLRRTCHG